MTLPAVPDPNVPEVYRGKHFERTKSMRYHARERVLAEAWAKEQKDHRILDHLLHSFQDERPSKGYIEHGAYVSTSEEHRIAATVIQWLGSPIGRSWLEDVLKVADREHEAQVERRKRIELEEHRAQLRRTGLDTRDVSKSIEGERDG